MLTSLTSPTQVDQIMGMRSEMLRITEQLRRAETDKLQLESEVSTLKQQVSGHELCALSRLT